MHSINLRDNGFKAELGSGRVKTNGNLVEMVQGQKVVIYLRWGRHRLQHRRSSRGPGRDHRGW